MAATKKRTTGMKKTTPKAKSTPRKKAAKRKAAPARKAPATLMAISSEERWRMIALAAYHKAEQRAFAPGKEIEDWLEAEREVDALLGRAES